jgi:HTH-type transcriptional regulator, competence development regulator
MSTVRNEFGKFFVNLRMDRGILLKDSATALQVSSSFLSNVEFGRKPIPEDWLEKISIVYSLSLQDASRLKIAMLRSQRTFQVTVKSEAERELMVAFIQNQDKITPAVCESFVDSVARSKGAR